MTTRKEKRMKRQRLISKLQRLEIQHQLVNGPDFILSQCKGCDICTQIRAIGEELSPSNVDICTQSGLTVESYHEMRARGMSDKYIAAELMVSPSSVKNWKEKLKVKTGRVKIEPMFKNPQGRPTGDLGITKEWYIEMRYKGMTVAMIAESLSCSRNTLRTWRKKNDLMDVPQGGRN